MSTCLTELHSFLSKFVQLSNEGFNADLKISSHEGIISVNFTAELGTPCLWTPKPSFTKHVKPSQLRRRKRRKEKLIRTSTLSPTSNITSLATSNPDTDVENTIGDTVSNVNELEEIALNDILNNGVAFQSSKTSSTRQDIDNASQDSSVVNSAVNSRIFTLTQAIPLMDSSSHTLGTGQHWPLDAIGTPSQSQNDRHGEERRDDLKRFMDDLHQKFRF